MTAHDRSPSERRGVTVASMQGPRRHGPGDWLLAGTTWVLLGIMRMLLFVVPFKRLMPLLGLTRAPDEARKPSPDPVPVLLDDPSIGRLPWAIAAAMRRTPWESKCLAQALAGAVMLRWRGHSASVFFGVRPADTAHARPMTAHAWLVSEGVILTGSAGHEDYGVVAVYATPRNGPWPSRADS